MTGADHWCPSPVTTLPTLSVTAEKVVDGHETAVRLPRGASTRTGADFGCADADADADAGTLVAPSTSDDRANVVAPITAIHCFPRGDRAVPCGTHRSSAAAAVRHRVKGLQSSTSVCLAVLAPVRAPV